MAKVSIPTAQSVIIFVFLLSFLIVMSCSASSVKTLYSYVMQLYRTRDRSFKNFMVLNEFLSEKIQSSHDNWQTLINLKLTTLENDSKFSYMHLNTYQMNLSLGYFRSGFSCRKVHRKNVSFPLIYEINIIFSVKLLTAETVSRIT